MHRLSYCVLPTWANAGHLTHFNPTNENERRGAETLEIRTSAMAKPPLCLGVARRRAATLLEPPRACHDPNAAPCPVEPPWGHLGECPASFTKTQQETIHLLLRFCAWLKYWNGKLL